jgi:hypothetical protein
VARANRSPRAALSRVIPGLNQGQNAALLEDDLGVQIQDVTLVANSTSSLNIILNSLLTSQVAVFAYSTRGFSGGISFSEVTDPTRSAVFLSVYVQGISAAIGNVNVPARVFLFQRAE